MISFIQYPENHCDYLEKIHHIQLSSNSDWIMHTWTVLRLRFIIFAKFELSIKLDLSGMIKRWEWPKTFPEVFAAVEMIHVCCMVSLRLEQIHFRSKLPFWVHPMKVCIPLCFTNSNFNFWDLMNFTTKWSWYDNFSMMRKY